MTGLPLGAAKGGADFNPRASQIGKCCVFANPLCWNYSAISVPIWMCRPADIGVGEREIGYLFGQYKRITGEFVSGVLTGKGLSFGGSLIRREATGFGAAFFAEEMLNHVGDTIKNKNCVVSVAAMSPSTAPKKIIELGGKVLTMSDSDGFIYDKAGIDETKLKFLMELKNARRGRISEYSKKFRASEYHTGKRPWGVPAQLAFPCATQNELNDKDAATLIKNGCLAVAEGANMPSSADAMNQLRSKIMFAPAKAANAAVSPYQGWK